MFTTSNDVSSEVSECLRLTVSGLDKTISKMVARLKAVAMRRVRNQLSEVIESQWIIPDSLIDKVIFLLWKDQRQEASR